MYLNNPIFALIKSFTIMKLDENEGKFCIQKTVEFEINLMNVDGFVKTHVNKIQQI